MSYFWQKERRAKPGYKAENAAYYRARRCKVENAKYYWAKEAYGHAKRRAKEKNLSFEPELTIDYILKILPSHCPYLGIELDYVRGNKKHARSNSPSLDRIRPEKGYTRANIMVISYRANSIKHNASIEELRAIFKFYDAILPSVEEMEAIHELEKQ